MFDEKNPAVNIVWILSQLRLGRRDPVRVDRHLRHQVLPSPLQQLCLSPRFSSRVKGSPPIRPTSLPHRASLSHMFKSPIWLRATNSFEPELKVFVMKRSLSTATKIYCFSYPSFMKLCKGDGSVFESQDLFKYMYSIKFSNRTHKIQIVNLK